MRRYKIREILPTAPTMSERPSSTEEELFELRPRLLRLFSSRGRAWAADDLADDTILRVLQKVRAGESIHSLAAYVLGVGRLVLLEHFRGPASTHEPLPEDLPAAQADPPDASEGDCLEECLQRLGADERSLILQFHGGGGAEGESKYLRKRLADEMGVSMNALFLRASRLRRRLGTCVGSCLDQAENPTRQKKGA